MSVFLLAGQSNMEGNVDTPLFQALLDELARGTGAGIEQRLSARLHDWYFVNNNGYASYGWSDAMAALETSQLVKLHGAGRVTSDLVKPDPKVLCAKNDTKAAPLATQCGNPFGPELMLGRVLATTAYAPTSLIKVAQGGTTLLTDWRSPGAGGTVGPWYAQLRARIQSLRTDPASVHPACATQRCRWAAFVWFQGENDSFDSANAQAYAANLKHLLDDVRAEVGSPALPVVVVQVGAWAQSLPFGRTVAAAQQAVVDADPRARLVVTSDLSGFYHYDPAAQLIIGDRVAQALLGLLAAP